MKKKRTDKEKAYLNLSQEAQYREQFRVAIEAAIIATVFVIPTSNILMVYLKWVVGFSAFFAGLYLIFTASTLKYSNPRELYVVFKVSERVRMKVYDWSIDVYAAGFLFFIAIVITGIAQNLLNENFSNVKVSIFVALTTLGLGIIFLLANLYSQKMFSKKKKQNTNKMI